MSTTLFHKTRPEQLATLPKKTVIELTSIITDVEARLINIKKEVFEIGGLLAKAKKLLPHGSFQLWLNSTFGKELPYSTANLYMKIYETFSGYPKKVQMLPVTFLMKMTEKTFPDEILSLINEHAEYCDKVDLNTIKEVYDQYKSGKIDLDGFMRVAKKQIDLGIAIANGLTQKRISKNMRKTLNYTSDEIINAIRKVRLTAEKMQFIFPPIQGGEEQQKIIENIDNVIQEFLRLKEAVTTGTGFFQPVISNNPFLGTEYFNNNENSNN